MWLVYSSESRVGFRFGGGVVQKHRGRTTMTADKPEP